MIRDFMSYRPPPELLAEMELRRLPADKRGFQLDVTSPPIREALDVWRRERGIAVSDPLSDKQRREFELWYMRRRFCGEAQKSPGAEG